MTDAASILYPSAAPVGTAPAPISASVPPSRDAASVLYGTATPLAPAPAAPPPTAAPLPTSSPEVARGNTAETLFGKSEPPQIAIPDNIRELREASATAADMLYAETVDPSIGSLFNGVDQMTVPERKAVAAELSRMARDVGLDHEDVAGLVSRAPTVRTLSPEQITERQGEAARMLREEFGDNANRALADAMKLATRDPRTKAILESTGLGNDPLTILKFARLAVRERGRGRL